MAITPGLMQKTKISLAMKDDIRYGTDLRRFHYCVCIAVVVKTYVLRSPACTNSHASLSQGAPRGGAKRAAHYASFCARWRADRCTAGLYPPKKLSAKAQCDGLRGPKTAKPNKTRGATPGCATGCTADCATRRTAGRATCLSCSADASRFIRA